MDNLAHTLVGAALGRAVADHQIPRAALLGAVMANAPDWTELLLTPEAGMPRSGIPYLVYHRGVTHSLVGAAVEIGALSAVVWIGGRWWARRTDRTVPTWQWIAVAAAVTVLSHLYMDWQGSYGLRPLLPWSRRWFYGDWVAIVDPFFWLVPLIGLAWGEERHWGPAVLVAVVGVPISIAILWPGIVAGWVKAVFVALAAVGLVGWRRHWFAGPARRRGAALSVAILGAYAALQGGASVWVKAQVRRQAEARFGPTAKWAALTVVGHPFSWQPIYASADSVAGPGWAMPRNLNRAIVQRALRDTPPGRAMAQFARFLTAEVEDSGGGVITVYLRDARYARTQREGWGVAAIRMETGR